VFVVVALVGVSSCRAPGTTAGVVMAPAVSRSCSSPPRHPVRATRHRRIWAPFALLLRFEERLARSVSATQPHRPDLGGLTIVAAMIVPSAASAARPRRGRRLIADVIPGDSSSPHPPDLRGRRRRADLPGCPRGRRISQIATFDVALDGRTDAAAVVGSGGR
jgi:hypothetical protein